MPCRNMFTSLPISPPMSWSSDTAKQMILWNGATCRSSGAFRGANVCVKSPRSRAIVPTGSGLLLGATISMAQQSRLDQRQHNKGAPSLLTGEHQQQLQRVASRKLPLMTACGLAQRSDGWANRAHDPPPARLGVSQAAGPLAPGAPSSSPQSRPRPARAVQARAGRRRSDRSSTPILTQRLELWAMDEHRVGLKLVIRRVWASRGHRPLIRVQHRYEWLYVYGFLHPETGASQWVLLQIA